MTMESAEAMAARLAYQNPIEVADAIEADRAAMALATIDELQAMVEDATHDGFPLLSAIIESAAELRAKYTKAGGAG
jgi:hypothetical protein